MPRTITFIRHAETEANAERRWQGATNSSLSRRGHGQVQRLASRFDGVRPPKHLIASDLDRTMRTAEALGEPVPDARWREFSVGRWEGLTSEEIRERFPGEMEMLFSGEDFAIGGAERMSAFRARVGEAFDSLIDDLDEGDEAVVVTHGGVIWGVANRVLGVPGGAAPMIPSHNTGVTRVRVFDDGNLQMSVFNDATHLDVLPTQFGPEGTLVTLFRHGQTEGNVAGRWQGRSDSPLTDHGVWQSESAAAFAPPMDALYTSPLGRTTQTAEIIADGSVSAVPDDGLVEMSFGSWENLTPDEAAASDPDLFEAVYGRGEDRPRGGRGESFSDAGARLSAAVAALVAQNGHKDLGVVSHGAVIRAYAIDALGLSFAERNRIPVPRNSSMSRVVYVDGTPVLASYNVAPHLD